MARLIYPAKIATTMSKVTHFKNKNKCRQFVSTNSAIQKAVEETLQTLEEANYTQEV